jgi:hypothetical protein
MAAGSWNEFSALGFLRDIGVNWRRTMANRRVAGAGAKTMLFRLDPVFAEAGAL